MEYKEINSDELEKILNQDDMDSYILLDVRTPREYDEEHIPDSTLINIYDQDFPEQVAKLDRDKTYYVYCRSGKRSADACIIMHDLGFRKLHNLTGGIIGWHGPTE
ncbi:MAG: rhodanese-like domain-containing protein [Candidatus Cyclobacteriaceae bacterium M3_2C_046]